MATWQSHVVRIGPYILLLGSKRYYSVVKSLFSKQEQRAQGKRPETPSLQFNSVHMTPSQSDDIPEALRESNSVRSPATPVIKSSSQPAFPLLWVAAIGVGAIALGAVTALLWQPGVAILSERVGWPTPTSESLESDTGSSSSDDPFQSTAVTGAEIEDEPADELLGHRRYDEASEESLVPVVGDASVRLREAAAEQFAAMVQSARAEGVRLMPLSGYRSEADQTYLFFEIKKDRKQSSQERAAVSAPPGYSEHHTGYAIDIGDADQPGANVSESFEDTKAFEWLEENASAYGFELSFGDGADSVVSYEPWHWRFVGDRHSLETFYGNGRPSESEPSDSAPSERVDEEG